jgi:hypothetical protein
MMLIFSVPMFTMMFPELAAAVLAVPSPADAAQSLKNSSEPTRLPMRSSLLMPPPKAARQLSTSSAVACLPSKLYASGFHGRMNHPG